jgi:integrase
VFTDTKGGIVDADAFRSRVFGPLLSAAKLRHIRLHDLRHTYASLLLAAGKEPHYIQQQLGHHSPAFTLGLHARGVRPFASPRSSQRGELPR